MTAVPPFTNWQVLYDDQTKAQFFLAEIKELNASYIQAFADLDNKAFSLVRISLPLTIAMGSAILVFFEDKHYALMCAAMAFFVCTFVSLLFLRSCLSPNDFAPQGEMAAKLLSNENFTPPYGQILCNMMVLYQEKIDINEPITRYKERMITYGFWAMTVVPFLALTVYALVLHSRYLFELWWVCTDFWEVVVAVFVLNMVHHFLPF